jgi:hypothetical protein
MKQYITEKNIKVLFKAYENEKGDRRDSELKGLEIKIKEMWLNIYKKQSSCSIYCLL